MHCQAILRTRTWWPSSAGNGVRSARIRVNTGGHKNVIFLDTADNAVPTRAIASPREQLAKAPLGKMAQLLLTLSDFENRAFYLGIQGYYDEIAQTPICEPNMNTRKAAIRLSGNGERPARAIYQTRPGGF